ncbi:hypothetical protein [Paracoccus versutus]|uniref:LexA DNA binding domain-containing protein n=1 Tax=Paracoccus versutus TaxID=34007 RepID=A0A3D9XNB1_PARVE|nr:hypothetical protein [Paracoccus versutus]REF69632.1 LexA DNA binding domain-containing protein [Paracoccus versutus]WGR57995.1 hypothetical protein E3U25_18840 [Paracoccus versutus]
MAYALTPTQHRLLDLIRRHLASTGTAPSFDEMRAAMGINSKAGIHRLLIALEDRGAIRRLSGRARAIEVVGPQDDVLAAVMAEIDGFCDAEGIATDSPLFRRLKQRLRQRLSAAKGGAA